MLICKGLKFIEKKIRNYRQVWRYEAIHCMTRHQTA